MNTPTSTTKLTHTKVSKKFLAVSFLALCFCSARSAATTSSFGFALFSYFRKSETSTPLSSPLRIWRIAWKLISGFA